ncbi:MULTISPECIES: hypothetical protein [Gracilimonas]|uniref:Uncharacterized protein n=1 Tax=Gracilimonas sediminicola TaxID=2952158 RepID=A0A9X2L406_9BACT|nr:hypothetical protein [Gracilimonas sediminicola]MCP9291966.1 hypothetical protein [Gracilimonas sediminicola]
MGQQQLLLVILVAVLVGIATVIAITVFGDASNSMNNDAVRQDLITISASVQSYVQKPPMLGGGGGSFDGFTFHKIAFPADEISEDGLHARNANGVYHVYSVTPTEVGLWGEPMMEVGGPVDISTLVSDSDYFDLVVSKDDIVWTNTPD